MNEDVALEFAADVESAVASVRELAAGAQELAGTAKEAADGCTGLTEAAGATAGELTAYADQARAAATAAWDLAAAQADLKTADAELKAAIADLGAAQATAGKESQDYADALEEVTGAMKVQQAAAEQLAAVQEQQAKAAAAAADETVAASDRAATATEGAAAASEGAAAKTGAAAESGLGKYKMALVGIGVGAAVAVDAAGKFQDSTTHLVTDAGESAKSLGMVQQGILGVSASTGTSASAITDAMYHIESSGFHAASGLAILKTTAEGAKVGGADLDTTSKALIGTLTAYYGTSLTAGQATKDSTSLMNQLITTVGSGDMRMQDLASSLSNVTPVAAAAHISFAQVGGAIATMTSQGMSARQATQNLAHTIRSLTSPTNVQAVEMKAMGLSANEVAKNVGKTGLAGTLDEMRDAVLSNTQGGNVMLDLLKGMSPAAQGMANQILAGSISTGNLTKAMKTLSPEQYALVSRFKTTATSVTGLQQTYTGAMSKMLGGATGLNVGLMLTGTHMGDLQKSTAAIDAESKKASGTVDNWSTIQGTFAFKTQQAKASLEDTGIALGSALLPAVTAVLGPIAHFLALVASNKAASIALAVVVGGILAGALGMKLAGALKDAKDGVKAAGDGLEWLAGKLTGAKSAQEAQTAATEAGKVVQEASAAESEAQAVATEALTAAKEESVGATEAATVAQTGLDVAMDANPIGIIIIAIVALIAIIVLIVTHLHFFAHAFDVVRHAVATAGHDIASGFDAVRHAVASIGDDIVRPFEQAFNWISSHWKEVLAWLVDPIGMAVFEIRTHTHEIAQEFDKLRHDVASILDGIRHDIASAWDGARHDAAAALDGARHDIASTWDGIRHDVAATVDAIPGDVEKGIEVLIHDFVAGLDVISHDFVAGLDVIRHTVAAGADDVVSFFEKLPGRVVAQLAALPGPLLTVGENVIKGLINGIVNAAASIPSIMSGLASDVASYFTDPLKLFSPSRLFFEHGFNIVQGAINGVKANTPALLATMRALGTGVGTQGLGSSYAAGAVAPAGGASVHVSVPMTVQGSAGSAYSDPRFQQYMQQQVQEAVLRYGDINPDNGLTPAWGR